MFIIHDKLLRRLIDYLSSITHSREAHMGDHTAYSTHLPVKELHELINELKEVPSVEIDANIISTVIGLYSSAIFEIRKDKNITEEGKKYFEDCRDEFRKLDMLLEQNELREQLNNEEERIKKLTGRERSKG